MYVRPEQTQKAVNRFAEQIAEIARVWPEPVWFKPLDMSPRTFQSRLRDALTSLEQNHSVLPQSPFVKENRRKMQVQVDGDYVVISPRGAKPSRVATESASPARTGLTISHPSDDELRALALLASNGRFTAPVRLSGISLKEATSVVDLSWDVAITQIPESDDLYLM